MTWIILPGMDGTGELAEPFVHALPREDVAVRVRYPRTRRLSRRDLIGIIDEALPIAGEYILVAESFSGPLAIEVASRIPPPKRMRALVLCATFAGAPIQGGARIGLELFGGLLMRLGPPRFVVRQLMLEADSPESEVERTIEVIKSVSGSVLADRLRMVLETNLQPRLSAIKIPTIITAAGRDRLVSRKATGILSAGIPNARTVWINGPHLLLQSRPKAVLDAVIDFLGSV